MWSRLLLLVVIGPVGSILEDFSRQRFGEMMSKIRMLSLEAKGYLDYLEQAESDLDAYSKRLINVVEQFDGSGRSDFLRSGETKLTPGELSATLRVDGTWKTTNLL